MEPPPREKPDIHEKGAPRQGQPQALDRRLFMQLLAFGDCKDTRMLVAALKQGIPGAVPGAVPGAISGNFDAVLYADLNDPAGVGLLTLSEDPSFFSGPLRRFLCDSPFGHLIFKPQLTMFGRTYALGYEPDLEETLFTRPRRTVLNPTWPWAIWYPLRRSGAFAQLPADQQRAILAEHGAIGRAFGEADYAHDIRLASHGLNQHDNDFVIGLLGKDLHPLSACVQAMRKTQQTSLYIQSLGPFFVGRVLWQAASR